jgi:DNA (cytosine-5)-methyltransferase 1
MAGFIDLYSGAGGTALGFIRAGFRHIDSFEIDKDARKTYSNNIQNSDDTLVSVNEFAPDKIDDPDNTVLIGCPPCQGFTILKKRGPDVRNDQTVIFAKKAVRSRAKIIFFENVPNIQQYEEFAYLVNVLKRWGYGTTWKILNAVNYGVPQNRNRLILLAVKNKKIGIPEASNAGLKSAISAGLPVFFTVRQAIGDLMDVELESRHAPPNHCTTIHGASVMKRIKMIPKNGGRQRDLPEDLIYKCHKKSNRGYNDVLGRMVWDAPSPTITSGCTNATKGRFIHPMKDRPITVREAARLQSFPDGFAFSGALYPTSTQVGNAVPPLIAFMIADRLWDVLN